MGVRISYLSSQELDFGFRGSRRVFLDLTEKICTRGRTYCRKYNQVNGSSVISNRAATAIAELRSRSA